MKTPSEDRTSLKRRSLWDHSKKITDTSAEFQAFLNRLHNCGHPDSFPSITLTYVRISVSNKTIIFNTRLHCGCLPFLHFWGGDVICFQFSIKLQVACTHHTRTLSIDLFIFLTLCTVTCMSSFALNLFFYSFMVNWRDGNYRTHHWDGR